MLGYFRILSSLILASTLINSVFSAGGDPIISSFNRDGFGRQDPNKLLNGFFPVWGIILLGLAGVFLLISVISFILYTFGCRPPQSEFKKVTTNQTI